METLRKFLIDQNKTLKEFCDENGFNYASFRVMVTGHYNPSVKMALKIEKATKGKVSRMELLYPKDKAA